MKDLVSCVGLLNFFDYSISMPHYDELFCMDIQSGLSFGDEEFGFNVYYGMDAALLSSLEFKCADKLWTGQIGRAHV